MGISLTGLPISGMHEFCTLTADLTPMKALLGLQTNQSHTPSYGLPFEITVTLGDNQIGAKIVWHEGVSSVRQKPEE
jgi:hypothetical protein